MNALGTKAIKDVTRRKLRTGLTVAGIGIGVMGMTALGLASSQIKASLRTTNTTSGIPDIQFSTAPTTVDAAGILRSQPNVKQVQAQGFVPARWSTTTGHATLNLVGLPDFSDRPFNRFVLSSGQVPGSGQILMEHNDIPLQPFHVGDRINLQVNGSPVSLGVSGISQTPGILSSSFMGSGMAYLPQAELQGLVGIPGPNVFDVRLQDFTRRADSAKQLAGALQAGGVTILGTTVGHDVTGGNSSILDGIFTIMKVLSAIAVLLSVFLLLSTITTLLVEQVPVIGTMKAIGATRGQVMRNYLAGVAIYGLIGTATGFGLGLLTGSYAVRAMSSLLGLYGGAFFVPTSLVVQAVVLGIGVPMVAALWPLLAGTRATVQQALSGYGVESRRRPGRGAWASLVGGVSIVPQTSDSGCATSSGGAPGPSSPSSPSPSRAPGSWRSRPRAPRSTTSSSRHSPRITPTSGPC